MVATTRMMGGASDNQKAILSRTAEPTTPTTKSAPMAAIGHGQCSVSLNV